MWFDKSTCQPGQVRVQPGWLEYSQGELVYKQDQLGCNQEVSVQAVKVVCNQGTSCITRKLVYDQV